jgi:membrane protein implicated in regulation of membrane protease activity
MSVLNDLVFWHWWILAAVLVGLEMVVPTTLLLWPGVAAAVTGLVLLLVPGMEWQAQMFVFGILAVIAVASARVYFRLRPQSTEDSGLNRRAERYINQQFTLDVPIVGGKGKLKVDDTTWHITGDDMAAGARVRVTSVDGDVLHVEV